MARILSSTRAASFAGGATGQAAARLGNGLEFHMPAADGAYQLVGKHGHPGAAFARGRALGAIYGHKAGRAKTQFFQ